MRYAILYIDEDGSESIIGPFRTMSAADIYAERLTSAERTQVLPIEKP
jgi:hypothetical protein